MYSHQCNDEIEPELPDGHLAEIAEGVFAWIQPDGTWWINNAGFVTGGSSIAVVDTCATERRTRQLLDAVDATCPASTIDFAVNTHHHGDHTFGNSMLPASTCLVGHASMREALLNDSTLEAFPPFWSPTPEFGALSRRVPNLTVSDAATLHLGDRQVDVVHPGYPAHTDGDLVVWVPDQRVLFAGDLLFPGHTPMVLAGTPSGAIRSLEWIASFDPAVVVPGHGELIAADRLPEVLTEHETYYRFVLAEARRGIEEHLSPLEVARSTDLTAFEHLLDPERFVLNIHSAYAELGGPAVHRHRALSDAVEWLGSPIRTRV